MWYRGQTPYRSTDAEGEGVGGKVSFSRKYRIIAKDRFNADDCGVDFVREMQYKHLSDKVVTMADINVFHKPEKPTKRINRHLLHCPVFPFEQNRYHYGISNNIYHHIDFGDAPACEKF